MTPSWLKNMSAGPWRNMAKIETGIFHYVSVHVFVLKTYRLLHRSSRPNDIDQDCLHPPANSYRYGYSIMKKIFFILLPLLSSTAYADEVFKCRLKSGKTAYQSTPCQSALKQQTIEIEKTDPRKVAEAEAKLKAWEEDFAKREQARVKEEQELQAENDRKASVEALQRSAEYQQQQAYEAKRQADALERQGTQNLYLQPYPYSVSPGYQSFPAFPTFQPVPAYPSIMPHKHEMKDQSFTERQQSERARHDQDRDNGGARFFLKWQ